MSDCFEEGGIITSLLRSCTVSNCLHKISPSLPTAIFYAGVVMIFSWLLFLFFFNRRKLRPHPYCPSLTKFNHTPQSQLLHLSCDLNLRDPLPKDMSTHSYPFLKGSFSRLPLSCFFFSFEAFLKCHSWKDKTFLSHHLVIILHDHFWTMSYIYTCTAMA